MKTPIVLVQDFGGLGAQVCCPEKAEQSHPELHYTGKEDLDLPQSGTMTVKFRVRSETRRAHKSGEQSYECCVEICSIEKVVPDVEPYKRDKSAEEALDELMEKRGEDEGEEDDEGEEKEEKFDKKELELGTMIEMEHTDDPAKSEEMAKTHLRENPTYYSQLVKAGLA
jgi:hypothetical protein